MEWYGIATIFIGWDRVFIWRELTRGLCQGRKILTNENFEFASHPLVMHRRIVEEKKDEKKKKTFDLESEMKGITQDGYSFIEEWWNDGQDYPDSHNLDSCFANRLCLRKKCLQTLQNALLQIHPTHVQSLLWAFALHWNIL